MALGAFHGQSHPSVGRGLDPIDGVLDPEFFGDDPAFVRGRMVAVETGCDLLLDGGFRQEIPASCSTVNWSKGMFCL